MGGNPLKPRGSPPATRREKDAPFAPLITSPPIPIGGGDGTFTDPRIISAAHPPPLNLRFAHTKAGIVSRMRTSRRRRGSGRDGADPNEAHGLRGTWQRGLGALRLLTALAVCQTICVPRSRAADAPDEAAAGGVALQTAQLEYFRGPGAQRCPDRDEVVKAIAGRLGFNPFGAHGDRIVRCEVVRDEPGLRAIIEARDAAGRVTGTRILRSPRQDCSELGPALTLVLGLAAGKPTDWGATPQSTTPTTTPATATTVVKPGPAATPTKAATAAGAVDAASRPIARPSEVAAAARRPDPGQRPTEVTTVVADAPAASDSSRPAVLVAAGALATLGALPSASWGVLASGGLGWRRLSVSLEGRYDAPADRGVDSGVVSLWAASLSAVPCLHHGRWAACALAGVSLLRGVGREVPGARTGLTAGLQTGARVAFHLGRAAGARGSALRVHADVLAHPVDTTVQIGDAAVWTTPRLSGALGFSWFGQL